MVAIWQLGLSGAGVGCSLSGAFPFSDPDLEEKILANHAFRVRKAWADLVSPLGPTSPTEPRRQVMQRATAGEGLVRSLMASEPGERPSPSKALLHPWFKAVHSAGVGRRREGSGLSVEEGPIWRGGNGLLRARVEALGLAWEQPPKGLLRYGFTAQ